MLEVKAATGWLNTDRFGDRNLHYWLAPLDLPGRLQGCVGLATDRTISHTDYPRLRIPRFDFSQAWASEERHAWSR
jgi:hypothetical protein